jgi:hypothetical protein
MLFRLHLQYPSPSISPLSDEDDNGKLDSYVELECDLKGHISYQRDIKSNEYNSGRMAILSCGTTNARGWYVSGSNSPVRRFFERGFRRQPGPLAK